MSIASLSPMTHAAASSTPSRRHFERVMGIASFSSPRPLAPHASASPPCGGASRSASSARTTERERRRRRRSSFRSTVRVARAVGATASARRSSTMRPSSCPTPIDPCAMARSIRGACRATRTSVARWQNSQSANAFPPTWLGRNCPSNSATSFCTRGVAATKAFSPSCQTSRRSATSSTSESFSDSTRARASVPIVLERSCSRHRYRYASTGAPSLK